MATPRVLPGFGISLGITITWLSLIVLIPLAALVAKSMTLTFSQFWEVISATRTLAAMRLSFGAAFVAALVNLVAGVVIAWVLVRYRFPSRRLADALIDLPFALPTAVAGIALTQLYAPNGWIGSCFVPGTTLGDATLWLVGPHGVLEAIIGSTGVLVDQEGLKLAFSAIGVTLALIFVTLPFVVRTLQPIIEELPQELEEAAASMGASRFAVVRRVILPELLPAAITGFALAFARGVGEYGSVIFIAGNIQGETEIAPLLIVIQLEQYQYGAATAIAVFMLCVSFALLLAINALQRWSNRRAREGG